MPHTPQLRPLPLCKEGVHAEFFYEKQYTVKRDATHDADHLHDFYEIDVNLGGDVSFLVEDTRYLARRGDVVVIRPTERHQCICPGDGIHEHFCIRLDAFPLESERLRAQFHQQTLVVLPPENQKRLIELCFALCQTDGADEGQQLRTASRFFEVLDLICNNHADEPPAPALPKSFSEIVDYITAHYAEPSCTVALLCDRFYISKSTLCRRFHRYFQISPSDYIESKRFSEAKKLLVAGQSVQDAGLNSGFSDCSYFILRFRKKFGMTPYRYQKSMLRTPTAADAHNRGKSAATDGISSCKTPKDVL